MNKDDATIRRLSAETEAVTDRLAVWASPAARDIGERRLAEDRFTRALAELKDAALAVAMLHHEAAQVQLLAPEIDATGADLAQIAKIEAVVTAMKRQGRI